MILQPARPGDVDMLDLRPEDLAEVSPGWQERVREAIVAGGAFSGWDLEGNLVGIGGVFATGGDLTPWLLCTRRVAQHRASVWRIARRAVAALRGAPQRVSNFVPTDSPNAAFVRRLGFTLKPSSSRPGWLYFFFPHV